MKQLDYQKLKPVAVWLYITAAAVFCMAIIGAITRLTESGLSMVEWRPLIGALPPMNDAEWNRVFGLYQQTSEYKMAHSWMGLEDFKHIFFWEWFHRLWGRVIGLIYALPFFVFLIKGMIPSHLKPRFWGLLLLGALQGVMGWYMVQSGFADRTDVSHYRLAAHLGLAFIIFGALLALAMQVSLPKTINFQTGRLRRGAIATIKLAFVTIIWGAFVAGMNAGKVYNEFPMMGASLFPAEGLDMSPLWQNFFENHATVQFTHRWLAITTFLCVVALWWKGRVHNLTDRAVKARHMVLACAVLQLALGILTLLTQVVLPIAVLHQAGALLLFGSLIWLIYELKPVKNV